MTDTDHLSLVVIGHVDSGKSTTMGHLLSLSGVVDARQLAKLEAAAVDLGKPSYRFAYVFDAPTESRRRGMTMNIAMRQIRAGDRKVTIIDAPGHKDFVKNMVTGASQADAALLVVDARRGHFEAGLTGQTREHCLLAFVLGIRSLVVAVNKMDDPTVEYSQERYEEIRDVVWTMLERIGWKRPAAGRRRRGSRGKKNDGTAPRRRRRSRHRRGVRFVPISGWTGENLVERSPQLDAWYEGPTLMEAIQAIPAPKRNVDGPLRLAVHNVHQKSGVGTIVTGRVASGTLTRGMELVVAPTGIATECRSIEVHLEPRETVGPGENVGVNLKAVPHRSVRKGDVIGPSDAPPRAVRKFRAFVIVHKKTPIRVGYTPLLCCGTLRLACRVETLLDRCPSSGGEMVENPEMLVHGDRSHMILAPIRPIVVERFEDVPSLGRFALRDAKETIGIGVVEEILE